MREVRFWPVSSDRGRAERQLYPGNSDVDFLRDLDRVINLDTEVANGALDLGVAEKQLNGTWIAGPLLDQRCFDPSKRVRTELQRIETNARTPLIDETRILPPS
jgi:hypothetical protein